MSELLWRIEHAGLARMLVWLLAGVSLYATSAYIGPSYPQAQVIFQKLGNVTTFAWVGYWVARGALGRVDVTAYPTDARRVMARAIVVGAAIVAGALGL